jgi:hypothetical protein
MKFDSLPLYVLFLATIGLVVLAIEAGIRLGRRRQVQAGGEAKISGAMVDATMALLAFMLAFTFDGAASRHGAREALVVEDTNAIDKTWRHADFLSEPYRANMRALLSTYVDVRVKAAAGTMDLGEATRQSEALHEKMWLLAEEVEKNNGDRRTTSLFIQSLNDMIDVHLKRVDIGIRNRIPPAIWATLYLLTAVGMTMMGTQSGIRGERSIGMEVALAVSFSLVLVLIADLNRTQEGLISVSQQAIEELRSRLNAR